MNALPIDAYLESILNQLIESSSLIIEAAPGAGKTTRIPPALLDSPLSKNQQVWVLEPRRLAARLSATRIAQERNEELGKTVGYQVRYENYSSDRTRLLFLTEGLFTRKLIHNPNLNGVSIVVLDEFHERNLQTDVALALLRRLQKTSRPDLKIVVMSATMDCASISNYLDDCPIISCEGVYFDVTIDYLAGASNSSISDLVQTAVTKTVNDGLAGDILIFLSGAAEIRRASNALENIAQREGFLLAKLHGELSPTEQYIALSLSPQRKIILSTNVAETSITIEGLSAVIDSGLERTVEHSLWSGLPTSSIQRISQASAKQRAGRAGRTQPGKCIRLYSAMDFSLRPEFRVPEILRSDLSGIMLELLATGFDLNELAWLDNPTGSQIENSLTLLCSLGAIDSKNKISDIGKAMTKSPLHPRLSRLMVESVKLGIPSEGAILASMIAEREIKKFEISANRKISSINLLDQLEQYFELEKSKFDARKMDRLGFDAPRVQSVRRASQQLINILKLGNKKQTQHNPEESNLMRILCAGFPDRIAKIFPSDNAQSLSVQQKVKLCDGQFVEGRFSHEKDDWLLAVEVSENRNSSAPFINSYAHLNLEIIFDIFSDQLSEVKEVTWNAKREVVEEVNRLQYRELVLLESKSTSPSSREASQLLVEKLQSVGLAHFIGKAKLDSFHLRLKFCFGEDISIFEDEARILELCTGKVSFRELREALTPTNFQYQFFSSQEISDLDKNAPEQLGLRNSRRMKVHYAESASPFLEGYIQDFFGITTTPTLLNGKLPVTLNLLAPNKRVIQVTSDLPSFWKNIYPKLRVELGRKYPRHYWPLDPIASLPILLAKNVK